MAVHNNVRRFIDMRYHRNGSGGNGGLVTAFVSSGGEELIAVSVFPEMSAHALTPPDWFKRGAPEQERYEAWWVDAFARNTIVVNPGDIRDTKRGGDTWGFEIANEYRRRDIAGDASIHGIAFEGGSPDPASEWYRSVTADPAETARLMEANSRAVEEAFGLPRGTLG